MEFDARGEVLYAGHLQMPFVALYVNLDLNNKCGRISTNIPWMGPFLLPGIFQNILESVKKLRGSICRLSSESSMTCFEDQKFWNDLDPTKKAFVLSLISF